MATRNQSEEVIQDQSVDPLSKITIGKFSQSTINITPVGSDDEADVLFNASQLVCFLSFISEKNGYYFGTFSHNKATPDTK